MLTDGWKDGLDQKEEASKERGGLSFEEIKPHRMWTPRRKGLNS